MSNIRFRSRIFLLTFLLLAACNANGQKPTPTATPDAASLISPGLSSSDEGLDLVFQGGGAKGIAHIGAVRELEDQGWAYRRLVGTSAGSIVAVLLAAGFSADEMEAAITERTPDGNMIMRSFLVPPKREEFNEEQVRNSISYLTMQDILPNLVQDGSDEVVELSLENPFFRGLFSIVETGGLYSGEALIDWLRDQLSKDGRGLGNTTMAGLYEETGADLTIVATDTDGGIMLMLNHRTAPELPVVWAVRMSSSIPIVFQDVIWQPEWGPYLGKDISGHVIVDGGLTTNFPLDLVLSEDTEVLVGMELEPDPDRVLGLVLSESRLLPGLEPTPTPQTPLDEEMLEDARIEARWREIEDRTLNLVDTLMNANDRLIANAFPEHVCYLPVGGVETLEYDMSDRKIDVLMAEAGKETRICLEKLDN
jgi:predicted acylesterase/phospholipase RssA